MKSDWIQRWRLTVTIATVESLMCAPALIFQNLDENSIRMLIRTTARCSFVLFVSAFSASSLVALRPAGFTRWLARNRRYVGVGFAFSHTLHLAGIALLLTLTSHRFSGVDGLITLIGGGFAFVLLYAMALTSFDRTAAWLGAPRWRILHKTGMYYFWTIFFLDYLGMSFQSLTHLPLALLLAAAFVLRIAAWSKKRKRAAYFGNGALSK
jgi:DMSO/TMAO reductase YedYZ heme-binding membrane subunit